MRAFRILLSPVVVAICLTWIVGLVRSFPALGSEAPPPAPSPLAPATTVTPRSAYHH